MGWIRAVKETKGERRDKKDRYCKIESDKNKKIRINKIKSNGRQTVSAELCQGAMTFVLHQAGEAVMGTYSNTQSSSIFIRRSIKPLTPAK